MNIQEMKEIIGNLYSSIDDLQEAFTRKTYADRFEAEYKKFEASIIDLENAYDDADDKDSLLDELGAEPARLALEECAKESSKRKSAIKEMNLSLKMVTFVMPVLLHHKGEFTDKLTDSMIEKWGEAFPKSKINKAPFEELNDSFRRKWCYITTAVCDSLGKPDDCYELTLLRQYRDQYLAVQEGGQEWIREYYNIAPTIVKRIDKQNQASAIYRSIYEEHLKPCIQLIEEGALAETKEQYEQMVYSLKKTYFDQ